MSQKNEIKVFRGKVIFLSVKGLVEEIEIRLKRVVTVDRLPVDAQSMPEKEEFKQWDHLQDAHFPIVVNKKVELLIGIDNKQAFTPLDRRTGTENAPDALMTPLEWVLYDSLLHDVSEPLSSELSSCHVSMMEHNSGPLLINPAVHLRECGLETNNSQKDRIFLAKMKKKSQ